ncbi:MAG: repair protein RecN [Bacteroidota bacterium]|jgi:DNA repair protein RecN (Recombination protein N)
MLKHLSVSNYALIDKVNLDFESGLTAITGETGSGKSILLGAFGLLLGERADSKSIRDTQQKCVIEATFDLSNFDLSSFFEEHDLDYDIQTTIRREIAPGGKSRSFVNDTPVQLQALKALGEQLVDIHSQHENSLLGERAFQFHVTDAFARHHELMKHYKLQFAKYKQLHAELNECLSNEQRMREELDFFQFQLTELEKINLESIHQASLEQELETLNNAEAIKGALNQTSELIEGERQSILSALQMARQSLGKVSAFNPQTEELSNRIESCYIELKEIAREAALLDNGIHYDQARIDRIQETLNVVYQLEQKHRVQSIEELVELRNQLTEKIGGQANLDDRITALRKNLQKETEILLDLAAQLTHGRKKAAEQAAKEVKKYFSLLQLDHAELVIEISPSEDFNAFGKNEIRFLFQANKGGQLLPIRQVASGGEISRVMLAIKASISHYRQLPVLILDEIDQGVSGEAGMKMGEILKDISQTMQVLTITHLPQIAGKAKQHLKVYKESTKKDTFTGVRVLEGEDRINELAEMLSGKSYSQAALANARDLLS